jgi:hypothetical protein
LTSSVFFLFSPMVCFFFLFSFSLEHMVILPNHILLSSFFFSLFFFSSFFYCCFPSFLFFKLDVATLAMVMDKI